MSILLPYLKTKCLRKKFVFVTLKLAPVGGVVLLLIVLAVALIIV